MVAMAKAFARKFYKSQLWQRVRDSYAASKDGLCELCGRPGEEVHHIRPLTIENIGDPDIAYGFDNLQLLCRDCHFRIHDKAYKRKPFYERGLLVYDDEGNPMPKGKVVIVWGSPASGKTTYVKEHMVPGDLIVDLDNIIRCFTGLTNKVHDNAEIRPYLGFVIKVQDYVYKIIEERSFNFTTAWIIAGLPEKKERLALAERFHAELIHMDASRETALSRADSDPNRENKERQKHIINYYFERLEL